VVGVTSLIAPRRDVRTYELRGEVVYTDTGRPVAERLGSQVVLRIVEDADAWAADIEAKADAESSSAPKSGRILAENRRGQRYADAAKVRANGAMRAWDTVCHDAAGAEMVVADLRRSHPNPGVRYEVAEITAAGACPDCHQPVIEADGQWRHDLLRFPAECGTSSASVADDEAPDDGWTVAVGTGQMTCGYCHDTVAWAVSVVGYVELTGDHLLGRERATGRLVVLAEAKTPNGEIVMLPHHCPLIPEDVLAEYAADAVGA
jgi:hypothetical protein